jgi:hypothetical protein
MLNVSPASVPATETRVVHSALANDDLLDRRRPAVPLRGQNGRRLAGDLRTRR